MPLLRVLCVSVVGIRFIKNPQRRGAESAEDAEGRRERLVAPPDDSKGNNASQKSLAEINEN
jgi:hypothetical protein